MSVQDIGSWKLVGTEGVFADNARLNWPKVEGEYLAAHLQKSPDTTMADRDGRILPVPGAPLPMTEEVKRGARPYAQGQFADRVRLHLEPLGAAMVGQRPVKIRTTLHRLDVPSLGAQIGKGVVMAVMFGAGAATAQNQSTMAVSTEVVDAKTGAVLLSYPEKTLVRQGGEGSNLSGSTDPYVGDTVATMLGDYRNQFGRWLVKG